MVSATRPWRLAAVAAALLCAVVLASVSHAQTADDAVALNAELVRLYQAGKFAEATEIAERVLAIREKALGAEHRDVGSALNNLATLYRDQGRTAEAEPLLKRALAIIEKALGPDHPDLGLSLNNLAGLYYVQGRTAEAEPLYKRALAIIEKARGPEHRDVGSALNNLATLYRDQGRTSEAEPLLKRALAIAEKALGPDHPQVGQSLNNLALVYHGQGRYEEAEPVLKRALAIREKALGPDHPQVGQSLNSLAEVYRAQVRTAEAEPLYKRSLAIAEKALGPDHRDVGSALSNLATLYRDLGRTAEAEPLLKRSLAIRENALGLDHPQVSQSLNGLADVYRDQGRIAEAEPLYKRSLAIIEKALGPDHPDVGSALNDLATLYRDQGRAAEAEPLYKRSLAIREKALGPDHSQVGQSLSDLAALYRDQGRTAEAEPLLKRALAIAEKALGPDHPALGATLNILAGLNYAQGRTAEAEPLLKGALTIAEKALGPDHPDLGTSLGNLAGLALAQGDWAQAVDYWRRSTGVIQRRTQRGLAGTAEGSSKGEAKRLNWHFAGLVKTTHRLAMQGRVELDVQARAMFETAQWAQGSEAAASLAQMAARSAKGSPQLSVLVRERQDLVSEWQAKDKQLIATKSEPPAKRNAASEKVLSDRLAAIDTRVAEIDARLKAEFPDYAALASPAPLPAEDVQAQLGADEALVLFLDTDARFKPFLEETFVWVVTKGAVRWVWSELGTAALAREVAALRCGLDATAWYGEGARRCAGLLKLTPDKLPKPNDPLPFDHARAHALYKGLFGEVEGLIKGKHLLLVPSGPLTQLPFQVLVTDKARSDPAGLASHRNIAWLARDHAITVLPATSSLKALRRVGKPSAATKPMIGFGNPLVDGPDSSYADLALLARDRQRCPETRPERVASLSGRRSGLAPVATRGGLADLAHLKVQTPLPETADELCAVARDLGAEPGEMRLGARATEREIKSLSADGQLAHYRILHFATHGTLAGQLTGASEPGLILTPPAKATEEDDGYLSASEIAGLKLDADWVILSACNTAGGSGGDAGAEALSGLARAFFYAQARALLVAHWEVYSNATVKLIAGALRELARDPHAGRAEALRHSMLALIDKGAPHEAHPAYWAPFVVVGEGGRGR